MAILEDAPLVLDALPAFRRFTNSHSGSPGALHFVKLGEQANDDTDYRLRVWKA